MALLTENALENLRISAFSTDSKNLFSDSLSSPQATKCKQRAKRSVNAYVFELEQIKTRH
jgi:hypothetical protein